MPPDTAMLAISHFVSNSSGKMAKKRNGETLPQSSLQDNFQVAIGVDVDQARTIKGNLEEFCLHSGHWVNARKSQVPSLGLLRPWASSDLSTFDHLHFSYSAQDDGDWNVQRLSEFLDPSIVPHVIGVLPPSLEDRHNTVA
ncbi:hypothetical protein V6N12_069336 [Hibiscus sabdariffa]|uniref:Uncharacterized protein n=1 Tax=Hibiscus sabdariffa TaxID=183260 RepID=A0ABR2FDQ2_9ROSI